jgi:hypothetical protein
MFNAEEVIHEGLAVIMLVYKFHEVFGKPLSQAPLLTSLKPKVLRGGCPSHVGHR